LTADTADLSVDADNTLLQLDNYLIQLQDKNELLAAVIRELDSKMKDLDIEIPDSNIAQLVTARDQLLGNIFKYGMFIFSREKLDPFASMNVLQASNLENIVFDVNKLGLINSINAPKNREDLLKLLVKDKPLQMIFCFDVDKLGLCVSGGGGFGNQHAYGAVFFGAFVGNLKMIFSQDKLDMIFSGGTKEDLDAIVFKNLDLGIMNQMKEKGVLDKVLKAL